MSVPLYQSGSSGGGGTTVPFAFNSDPLTIPPFDIFTFSDAGPAAVFNSIALLSSGVTTNNLRKALSVYYQGDMLQGSGFEYYGIQSNSFGILTSGSLAGRISAFGGQFGWKYDSAVPTGLIGNGCMVQPRATGAGCTGGNLTSFISYNPQITSGATIDSLIGLYVDHAAIGSSLVTGYNIGLSVYVGTGAWALDLVGGNGSAFGPQPIYHATDAIYNGGALLDGWFTKAGTPEGSVSANPGSFCSNQSGGANTSFYVKESGTGNTGWKALLSAPAFSNITGQADLTTQVTGVLPAANGGVAEITTAGTWGTFFPSCDPQYDQLLNNAASGIPGTNIVRTFMFVLPVRMTVSKVVLDKSAANGTAGSHAYIGVYSANKSTLLIEAIFTADGGALVESVTLGSPVTLDAGIYWYAFGGDSATGGVTCRTALAVNASFFNAFNKNVQRCDTSNQVISSGHLPATLGTISYAGAVIAPAFFEA